MPSVPLVFKQVHDGRRRPAAGKIAKMCRAISNFGSEQVAIRLPIALERRL